MWLVNIYIYIYIYIYICVCVCVYIYMLIRLITVWVITSIGNEVTECHKYEYMPYDDSVHIYKVLMTINAIVHTN